MDSRETYLFRMLGLDPHSEEAQKFLEVTNYLEEKYSQIIEKIGFVIGLDDKLVQNYRRNETKTHDEEYYQTINIVFNNNIGEDIGEDIKELGLQILVENCLENRSYIRTSLCHAYKISDSIEIPCPFVKKEDGKCYCYKSKR